MQLCAPLAHLLAPPCCAAGGMSQAEWCLWPQHPTWAHKQAYVLLRLAKTCGALRCQQVPRPVPPHSLYWRSYRCNTCYLGAALSATAAAASALLTTRVVSTSFCPGSMARGSAQQQDNSQQDHMHNMSTWWLSWKSTLVQREGVATLMLCAFACTSGAAIGDFKGWHTV